jgi:hypothetical protein
MTDHPTSENKRARIRGAVSIAVGAGLVKWQIYDPLHAAENRRHEVLTSATLMALAILLPIYGGFLVGFGCRAEIWFREGLGFRNWKGTLRVIIVGLLCFGLYLVVQRKLYDQGYR